MMTAEQFVSPLVRGGVDFISGVPCSYLTPVLNHVITDGTVPYVGATSEGEAVAIGAGAWLAGKTPLVMCQNSGIGNLVNPVTSMLHPFRIPMRLVTTWRGQPGRPDEPQHVLMGQISHDLLKLIGFDTETVPETVAQWQALAARKPLDGVGASPWQAFVLPDEVVATSSLDEPPSAARAETVLHDLREHGNLPRRAEILEAFLAETPDNLPVIATTGKAGRELYTLADRPSHLYQVGSMGYASAMGLGVALNTPGKVVVFDGDGAALMHLGNLATIGAHRPDNLVHVVLDNGVHDSTGGQRTVSASVGFADVAASCGYASAVSCDSAGGFAQALRTAMRGNGPTLIHARIAPGSMGNLGRPKVPPHEVAQRFRAFLQAA